MPHAALEDKLNRSSTCGSKTADKEQAAPSLCQSCVSSVQQPDASHIAAPLKLSDNRSEISPPAHGHQAGDILQQEPAGSRSHSINEAQDLGEEAAPFIAMPAPFAGDGVSLAGISGCNKVNWRECRGIERPYVVMDRDARPVSREDLPAEGLDLAELNGLHAEAFGGKSEAADS